MRAEEGFTVVVAVSVGEDREDGRRRVLVAAEVAADLSCQACWPDCPAHSSGM